MMDEDLREDGIHSPAGCRNGEDSQAKDALRMEEGKSNQASRRPKYGLMPSSTRSDTNNKSSDDHQAKTTNASFLNSSQLPRFPLKISPRFMIDIVVSPTPPANIPKNDSNLKTQSSSNTDKWQSDVEITGSVTEKRHRDEEKCIDDTQETSSSQPLSQLMETLQMRQQASGAVCDTHQECTAIERRVRDFERARYMRFASAQTIPRVGILGLFYHLGGVRADLKWAEFAAYRRSRNQPYAGWADYTKEHDQNYHRRPYFTIFLFLASTAMMFYTMYLSDWKFAPLKVRYEMVRNNVFKFRAYTDSSISANFCFRQTDEPDGWSITGCTNRSGGIEHELDRRSRGMVSHALDLESHALDLEIV